MFDRRCVRDVLEASEFYSVKPTLLNHLHRHIEGGRCDEVEETILSNSRCLVTCGYSAIYLMAAPKYNACHVADRANRIGGCPLINNDLTSSLGELKKRTCACENIHYSDRPIHSISHSQLMLSSKIILSGAH